MQQTLSSCVRQHYPATQADVFTLLIIDLHDDNARGNFFKYLSGSFGRYVTSRDACRRKDQRDNYSRERSFRGKSPTMISHPLLTDQN